MTGKKSDLEKNLYFGIQDGAFYSMMVGIGESYLIPFALFLKATSAQVGLIVSVPQLIGAFFQILSAHLLSGLGKRKPLILAGVGLQALAWIPLLWLPLSYPGKAVFLLVAGISLYYLLGNLASPPWNSMMGDLVPIDRRGHYFGRRTRIMSLATFVALFLGGVLLDWTQKTGSPGAGFAILFMSAALFRSVSFNYLRKMTEPPLQPALVPYFLSDFYREFKSSNFLRFVVYSSLISFSVQVSAPFFAVYMLQDLHFTYFQYMIAVGTAVVSQYLAYLYWGNFSDRFGNRRVLQITGFLMPLLPCLWLFSYNFYYILAIQLFAGLIWSGFSLSVSIFVFDAVASEKRAVCIAVYSTLNALGIFLGAMAGGLMIRELENPVTLFGYPVHLKSNLMFLFLISGALRLLVYLIFLPKVREVRDVEPFSFKEMFQRRSRSSSPSK